MAINFTPDDVASGFNLTKLNSNFDKVDVALQDALSRSGTGPNQMLADIDLNNNDLLNVKQIDTNVLVLDGEIVQKVDLAGALKASNALSEIAVLGLQSQARDNIDAASEAQGALADTAAQKSVAQTNPTIPGWGVSFNPPSAPGYSNGMAHTYTLTGASVNPINGWLLNTIVDSTYDKDILGNIAAAPVAVGANIEMQVQKANAGNDFWCLLGVLDFQASGTGGQATAGIIRGQWTGTNIAAGLRAQAENYSGRAAYGVIVGASLTDGFGAPFDNTFSKGVFVHAAKDVGVQVGGLSGAAQASVPTTPFLFQTADGSQDLWKVSSVGGITATMSIIGSMSLIKSDVPLFEMSSTTSPVDTRTWQIIAEPDATWSVRTRNDANTIANDMIQIVRSGPNFSSFIFGNNIASVDAAGFVNASSGFRVGPAGVVGPRDNGWVAMTGTANKNTAYDVATITLAQLAGRVKSLQDALTTHGLLGA